MDTRRVIEFLGGTSEAARLCEVTPAAVSMWKSDGFIPRSRLMFLKVARPDLPWCDYHDAKSAQEPAGAA